MIYLILSFIFFKESGTVKKWDVLYKPDTVLIFYTLDIDGDRFAEELKLLKLNLKNKKVKNKVIYRDKEGIDKIKLIEHGNDYFLFFTLLRKLKEKRIKKSKLIFMFNRNKVTKFYELKKKNRFINNVDFIFERDDLFSVFDVRNRIYILGNSELYEFGPGVNPIFFKNFVLFLKGLPEKMNVLFKAKRELKLYKKKEPVFDKEPVLTFERKENSVIFLTDKDGDLLPEKIYLMNDEFEYKNIYDSDNHIIVIPSLERREDTTYILICVSEEFIPDKLILVKLSDKAVKKDILNKKGIETKWVYYPFFILLQKTETGSLFELTSVK